MCKECSGLEADNHDPREGITMAEPKQASNVNTIAVTVALVLGALLALGFIFRFPW
jgi:hypothetical protein